MPERLKSSSPVKIFRHATWLHGWVVRTCRARGRAPGLTDRKKSRRTHGRTRIGRGWKEDGRREGEREREREREEAEEVDRNEKAKRLAAKEEAKRASTRSRRRWCSRWRRRRTKKRTCL